MNQVKIGKFIASCRKDKKMTQIELADKLGVTDRAVSHWENGRSLPDVSLYKDLCECLGISIEELINGEKDNSLVAKEKAILTVVNEKNNIKKYSRKTTIILGSIFFVIISCLIFYNKKLKINLVDDSDYLYDEVINIIRNEEFRKNSDSTYKDFNVFYSYYGFGIEKKNDYKFVYMWICNHSYYIEESNSLVISSGSSVPAKAIFKNNHLQTIIYPKDGNEYVSSIKKMFPIIIKSQVLNFDNGKNINKMFNEIEQKKNTYYDYLNLDMSKITIDDLVYDNLIFSIEYKTKECNIPVLLNVFKNNKYTLGTSYKDCKPNQMCTSMLEYIDFIEGDYDFDVLEIIRHSKDANMYQYNDEYEPYYEIYSGKNHPFITDDNNKYLKEFLTSINVNLNTCATPKYIEW